MLKKRVSIFGFFCLFVVSMNVIAGTTHTDKIVRSVLSPDYGNNRDCAFFQLVDVAEADPVVPGRGWFAIKQDVTSEVDDATISMLLSAYMGGKSVTVQTSGNIVCGFAEASYIWLR